MTKVHSSEGSAPSSMTGFARSEGAHADWRWAWELRSVNGRSLEMRFRLPPGLDAIEPALRIVAKEMFARGNLNASLNLGRTGGGVAFQINRGALNAALDLIAEIESTRDCAPTSAASILSLRGVMEAGEETGNDVSLETLRSELIASFNEAVFALKVARASEGAAMAVVLAAQLDDIERLVAQAKGHAAVTPAALYARLEAQLKDILANGAIPEERLAHEAALLAVKADIREELDRLDSHIEAARLLLAEDAPIGRRFDFLTQEFNREANTLCSKASDIDLKRVGLELKSVIDQMREQVQNIE